MSDAVLALEARAQDFPSREGLSCRLTFAQYHLQDLAELWTEKCNALCPSDPLLNPTSSGWGGQALPARGLQKTKVEYERTHKHPTEAGWPRFKVQISCVSLAQTPPCPGP